MRKEHEQEWARRREAAKSCRTTMAADQVKRKLAGELDEPLQAVARGESQGGEHAAEASHD